MKETKWQRAERYAKKLAADLEGNGGSLQNIGHLHIAKVAFRAGVEAGRRDAKRDYGMSKATATKLLALAQEQARLKNKLRSNTRIEPGRCE